MQTARRAPSAPNSRPAASAQLPQSEPPQAEEYRWSDLMLRMPLFRTVIILTAIAIITAGTALVPRFFSRHPSPIPANISKQLTFTLYYPYSLPAGYTVDASSFQTKGQVLIYSINAPGGKNIAVSEQPVPHTDVAELGPPDAPSGSPINTTKHYDVPVGKAVIGIWGTNFVSSIIAGQTWLILNANGFTYDQAAAVSRSFTYLH